MALTNRFDLNLLTAFEAIYTRGSVSQAARHLNLSQPTISHALSRLRGAFSDPLFVRDGNAMVPTAVARALVGPVREALRTIEVSLAGSQAFDPASSKRAFRIGMRPSGEFPAFTQMVAVVRRQAPGVTLTSRYLARSGVHRMLATGEIDVALDLARPTSGGIESLAVSADPLAVIGRPGHPADGQTLTLDEYLAAGHVYFSPRAGGLGLEDAALTVLGHSRRIVVRCQNAVAAGWIVADTDLLCTLPLSYAEMLASTVPLAIFPLPFTLSQAEMRLYWHTSSNGDPAVVWLREAITIALHAEPDVAVQGRIITPVDTAHST